MKSSASAARAAAPDVGDGGIRPPVGDVGGDGVGEQESLLEHHTHRAAQVGQPEAADVDAGQADRAGLCLVEPRQQQRHRRLARPGGADQGHRRCRPARAGRTRRAPVRPWCSRSATPSRRTSSGPSGTSSAMPTGSVIAALRIDDLHDPLDGRPRLLAEDQQERQRPGRRDQLGQVEVERQEGADGDRCREMPGSRRGRARRPARRRSSPPGRG